MKPSLCPQLRPHSRKFFFGFLWETFRARIPWLQPTSMSDTRCKPSYTSVKLSCRVTQNHFPPDLTIFRSVTIPILYTPVKSLDILPDPAMFCDSVTPGIIEAVLKNASCKAITWNPCTVNDLPWIQYVHVLLYIYDTPIYTILFCKRPSLPLPVPFLLFFLNKRAKAKQDENLTIMNWQSWCNACKTQK